ncbi:hypothetical protein HQ563_13775 [bacterium]|nr:hypothetical protein [bacterium]
MKNLQLFAHFFLAVTILLLVTTPAMPQNVVPMLINYQGELRDPATGDPMEGTYDILFRIYDDLTDTSPAALVWNESHAAVDVAEGIFSVILGSATALSATDFSGPDRWLEIEVAGETLEPRQRIASVAYSIVCENSRLLGGKEASELAEATHVHAGEDIASGIVSEGRIDPLIARDSETDAAVVTHAAIANAHHERYGDSEAVAVMGVKSNTNPLHHDRYADAEAVAAMGAKANTNPLHHDKTTSFGDLTDAASDAQIPAAIARDTEVDSKITDHAAIAGAHHTKYTDLEAVAAMGAKANTNPLHHDKTTSFADLTDAASDAQIPAAVARDTEVSSEIGTHGAIAGAHHAKTTSFAELTDAASDAQIPAVIARDSEIAGHAATADAHHARYTDTEAVSAMGLKSDTNPLHHDKTTSFSELSGTAADGQIPTLIARDSEIMPTVLANDGTGSGLDADTVDGMQGAVLEESAEIDADIAAHKGIADAHHARYTNSEAVAAMGAKSDTNPLNHDRTTSLPWGSITSIPAGFADGIDNDSGAARWSLTGNSGTSPGTDFLGTTNNVALQLHVNNARAFRLEPGTSPNFIGGYKDNAVTVGAMGAAIGGGGASGYPNRLTDDYGVVGGGYGNRAGDNAGSTYDAPYATVGGGFGNTASGYIATLGGGALNTASGWYATVGGGRSNTASGDYATVAGGRSNTASGNYSFAGGRRAIANNTGSFVWGDSTYADVASSAANQFTVRATGGVRFFTNSGLTAGVELGAGSSAWSTVSHSALKRNIRPVDGKDILSKLSQVPMSRWSYKAQDPDIEHIGPMAEHFYGAFGLGEDDKHISTVDPDGVALAAIQGLHEIVQEKDAEISALERENAELEARLTAVEALVERLAEKVGGEE